MDAVVVGGGPAGLAAATWLARYRRRVVVVDSGEYRNQGVRWGHGYLGSDRIDPAELRARAATDLLAYPDASMVDDRVTAVGAEGDGACAWVVRLGSGADVQARRLVLATGVADVHPAVDGFEEHWGTGVFSCPSCDGYEAEGRNVLVVGHDEAAAGFALGLLDWAASVTLVAPFGAAPAERTALDRSHIRHLDDAVVAVLGPRGDLRCARLASGEEIACDIAFFTLPHAARADLADALGCERDDDGAVVVDEHGETTVPGVYAAGDLVPGPHLIQVAAAGGAVAGIGCALSLRGEAPRSAPDPVAAMADARRRPAD